MPLITRTFDSPVALARFVNDTLFVSGAALVAGGSGYKAGERLVVQGGTFRIPASIIVGTVDGGGAVLTASVQGAGDYSVAPGNPVSVTGGSGTLATFNLTLEDIVEKADIYDILHRAGQWTLLYEGTL